MVTDLGLKIKTLREEHPTKMSQEELAYLLGVSQPVLSDIERGITQKIDFSLVYKCTKIFNVDFQYFTSEKDTKKQFSIEVNEGQIGVFGNNYGSIMQCPEKIIEEIKKIVNGFNCAV